MSMCDYASGVGPLTVGSRSQLATNRFLISLSQVFGWGAFTSRDVSYRFGLDFLNTSKLLSRMAGRPYYLLSVRRVTRPSGGFQNSYTISPRGWSRISYLQRQAVPPQKPASVRERAGGSVWAARYLSDGKGEESDLWQHFCYKILTGGVPPTWDDIPPTWDETGLLMSISNPQALPLELLNMHLKSPQDEALRTLNRALYLQRIGLIPEDINLPLFVLNAYERGSSKSTILEVLLIRGGMKLLDKIVLLDKQSNFVKALSKLDCGGCRRYKIELEEAQRTIKSLKLDRELQQEKSEAASHKALLENLQNDRLVHLIVGINQCLAVVSKYLTKFDDSSITVISIKSFIHDSLLRISLMSYLIVSSIES